MRPRRMLSGGHTMERRLRGVLHARGYWLLQLPSSRTWTRLALERRSALLAAPVSDARSRAFLHEDNGSNLRIEGGMGHIGGTFLAHGLQPEMDMAKAMA